ncbi:hypothetical protein [Natrinema amylolyticum]|uniref:hypothetical protein n=1 Tax=Natrinema amylolyticum TaxID=2878679 RepID=UPI001CFBDBED|nr:hypothetical protein [Natrinema amylolyticum]
MVALDVMIALLHPLAAIALSTLWTLKILRTEYREHLLEANVASEDEPRTAEPSTEV